MSLSLANEALSSFEAQWNAAGANWEPEKFATLFTDDALFFGGKPELYTGKNIKNYYAAYVGMAKSATIKIVDPHFLELAPDAYAVQGFVGFRSTMADGKAMIAKMRGSFVIVKQDGAWKVRLHQISTIPT